jgi:hypothetical protein
MDRKNQVLATEAAINAGTRNIRLAKLYKATTRPRS